MRVVSPVGHGSDCPYPCIPFPRRHRPCLTTSPLSFSGLPHSFPCANPLVSICYHTSYTKNRNYRNHYPLESSQNSSLYSKSFLVRPTTTLLWFPTLLPSTPSQTSIDVLTSTLRYVRTCSHQRHLPVLHQPRTSLKLPSRVSERTTWSTLSSALPRSRRVNSTSFYLTGNGLCPYRRLPDLHPVNWSSSHNLTSDTL